MIEIELFSDYMCPFCYIGFSIADKLVRENDNVTIHWKTSLLNPDTSLDGEDNSKLIPKERLEAGYKRITSLGEEYGLVYNNRTKSFNTNRLHMASKYANEKNKFYEFSKEAFKTVFEYGENVGKKEVVDKIARKVGLDVKDMNSEIDSGKYEKLIKEDLELKDTYGIDSVPSFVVNKEKLVTNLKPYEEFKKDLLG